jgi:hypothetical protein
MNTNANYAEGTVADQTSSIRSSLIIDDGDDDERALWLVFG